MTFPVADDIAHAEAVLDAALIELAARVALVQHRFVLHSAHLFVGRLSVHPLHFFGSPARSSADDRFCGNVSARAIQLFMARDGGQSKRTSIQAML